MKGSTATVLGIIIGSCLVLGPRLLVSQAAPKVAPPKECATIEECRVELRAAQELHSNAIELAKACEIARINEKFSEAAIKVAQAGEIARINEKFAEAARLTPETQALIDGLKKPKAAETKK